MRATATPATATAKAKARTSLTARLDPTKMMP
jgi:hypothetical protein